MANRVGRGWRELVHPGPGGWWGLLSLLASGLAVGTLPDATQKFLGDAWIGLGAAVVVGLGVYFIAEFKRRPNSGVGIVVHLYDLPDAEDRRIEAYQRNALERHASCFVVNVPETLRHVAVSEPVHVAFRTAHARLSETDRDAGLEATDNVSLYLSARHQDAFEFGGFLRSQVHRRITVMGSQFSQNTVAPFPAVRLDSRLETQPKPSDRELLREVLDRDPDDEPEWQPFEGASADAPSALVLAVAKPEWTAKQASRAAEHGTSEFYRFPGNGSPEENRCAGALIIRAGGPGGTERLPDGCEHYEALLRYVFVHWQRCLDRNSRTGFGWLFTDAPIPLATALGWRFRLDTRLVTHIKQGTPPSA